MKLRLRIYQLLVNRVPVIQKKYHSLRQQKRGPGGRVYAWTALIGMNVKSLVCKKKYEELFYYPDKDKKLPKERSESSLSKRETPKAFAERLKQYDVISFDVFDTLVLRPFAAPTDLFFLVGEKLNYLDFERIRKEMEWRARQKAKEQTGLYEVTLEQIYEELEMQAGVPKEKGMQAEIETETELCFGNPYMLEVFKYLKNCGKKIICTSDMYLPREVIQQMVEKCGFKEGSESAGISEYFISCECCATKTGGSLFERVRDTFGPYKKYIHIGDHPVSDVEWAQKSGFATEFYQNVNIAGMPYRAEDMSIITGSIYRGIVNAHIHNGLHEYSQEYELGFIYGGLFVLGYCQWIHEYVQAHQIDKILFLSRDGDILHQVYTTLYPGESGEGKTEYVYWSRLAAVKMSARYYKYDYFRRFIDHKVNQDYTLEAIFKSMEIEDMLEAMCTGFPNFAEKLLVSDAVFGKSERMIRDVRREAKLTPDSKLTDQNAWLIKEYLITHWEEVLAHYEEQLIAGKLYYEKVLAGCKRVVAVDVGWAGSGAVALNHIVNDIWHLNCEVIGLLAGTNTVHNAEPNMSEPQLQSGKLVSYMYSQGHNRDIWKWHDAAKGHNLGIELLCSSAQGSLRGFYPKAGQMGAQEDGSSGEGKELFELQFKEPDVDAWVVEEIQRGIRDFVKYAKDFSCLLGQSNMKMRMLGSDVYGVLRIFLDKRNYDCSIKAMNSSGARARMEMGI
ncbi:MAG: HAD family hydrolase [Lachnospiraceae bacterium]